jgi:hypothetical protein
LKEKEKGDYHVTFDDENEFFSHTPGLTLYHFVSSSKDVYVQGDEFDVYSATTKSDLQHHMLLLFRQCVMLVMTALTNIMIVTTPFFS